MSIIADEIFIQGLRVETIIGLLPQERINAQPIEIDLALKTNIRMAAQSENVSDTLDYAAISQGLSGYIQSTQFQLIETLAESIVQWLWKFSPSINQIYLELRKPMAVQQAKTVGLKISRTRSE